MCDVPRDQPEGDMPNAQDECDMPRDQHECYPQHAQHVHHTQDHQQEQCQHYSMSAEDELQGVWANRTHGMSGMQEQILQL